MSSYRHKCTMLRRVVLHFRFVVLAHNYREPLNNKPYILV